MMDKRLPRLTSGISASSGIAFSNVLKGSLLLLTLSIRHQPLSNADSLWRVYHSNHFLGRIENDLDGRLLWLP